MAKNTKNAVPFFGRKIDHDTLLKPSKVYNVMGCFEISFHLTSKHMSNNTEAKLPSTNMKEVIDIFGEIITFHRSQIDCPYMCSLLIGLEISTIINKDSRYM